MTDKLRAAEPAKPDHRAIIESLGFDPTNHHNAAKCPYCTRQSPVTGAPSWPDAASLIVAAVEWSRSNPPERARRDFTLRGRINQWLYDARRATGIAPDDAILAVLNAQPPTREDEP